MNYTRIFERELNRLAESGLSASAILVYMALAKRDYDGSGEVFPNIDTLQADLGGNYSRSSIEKALKKLVDAKLILRNAPRSKKRWVLVVRKAALFQFNLEQVKQHEEAEKSYSQEPPHVTDKNRNILRHKKNKRKTLFLYKPEISELGQMIQHQKPGSWPSDFLLAVQKKALENRPLKRGQIKKYLELRKQYRKRLGIIHLETDGKGEAHGRVYESDLADTSLSPTADHPEIGKPTWGDPEWKRKKKPTTW